MKKEIEYKNFAKTFEKNLDEENKKVMELLDLNKVRMMPDCHIGKGCSIGFTAPLTDKIHPEIVGVDIGCGMTVLEFYTDFDLSINLGYIDHFIRRKIAVRERPEQHSLVAGTIWSGTPYGRQMGTLGGGNHFIEIAQKANGVYCIVVHSGSRKLGKDTCDYYTKLMKKDNTNEIKVKIIKQLKEEGRKSEIESVITQFPKFEPKGYIEGEQMEEYIQKQNECVEYASLSRKIIVSDIAKFIREYAIMDYDYQFLNKWESVHNFIDPVDKIIRKGATPARKGQKVIIPMNMAFGSIIGIGLGNEDWNCSAPHGAGRIMSRTKAKQELSLDEAKEQMSGIFTQSLSEKTLDEAPNTYKNPNEIIGLIDGTTIKVLEVIKPLYNFKNEN